jgi:hypothetical protein
MESVASDRNKVFFDFFLKVGFALEGVCQIGSRDLVGRVLDFSLDGGFRDGRCMQRGQSFSQSFITATY